MKFCPQCGQRLISRTIEGRERPQCDPEQGGCGFIDFGHYSLGVGGIVMHSDAAAVLLIQRNQEPNRENSVQSEGRNRSALCCPWSRWVS